MKGAVALLAVAGALMACPSPDGGSIQFTLAASPEELVGYETLVEEFTDATGLEVDLAPVANRGDLLARLSTAISGGQPPDVFLINYRNYGRFAADGALAPVQSLLDSSDELDASDFVDAAFESFRYDGDELTCMPQNASSLVVYYNADLFAAAGIDPPRDGWTWDDFLAAGRGLTDGDTYGIGLEPSVIRLAPFVWSNGGEVVDDDLAPTTMTLDAPAARAAYDFFIDLQTTEHVVPPDAEEEALDMESRFLRGQLGMYLNSRVAVPTLRTITDFAWDAGPLPVAPGGRPVSILHSDAYCISDGSDQQDDAWRFIEFAMGERGQTILAESGRTVPSRRDVAGAPVFLEPDDPPASSQVYLDNLDHLRAVPHVATWAELEDVGDSIIADVFYGRLDRDDGLEQLLEESRRLLGT